MTRNCISKQRERVSITFQHGAFSITPAFGHTKR